MMKRRKCSATKSMVAFLVLTAVFGSACKVEKPSLVEASNLCDATNAEKRVFVEGYFLDSDEVKCFSKDQGKKKCMLTFASAAYSDGDYKLFSVYLTTDDIGKNIVQPPRTSKDLDFVVVDLGGERLSKVDKVRLTGVVAKPDSDLAKKYTISAGCYLDASLVEKAVPTDAEISERETRKKETDVQLAAVAKFVKERPELEIQNYEMHHRHRGALRLFTEKKGEVSAALDAPEHKPLADVGITSVTVFDKRHSSLTRVLNY